MRITVVTYLPSPYQIELFDAIADANVLDLEVIYLNARSTTPIARQWAKPKLHHRHIILEAGTETDARRLIETADLAVFNFYRDPAIPSWMRMRTRRGLPWAFWGERLGATRWSAFGTMYRYLKLAELRRCAAPIWGIGGVAVESYRRIYGGNRLYVNLPYFSDLQRFAAARAGRDSHGHTFLYSGALIERKGVDVLARAFKKLHETVPGVRLKLVGSGPKARAMARELAACGDAVELMGFRHWEDLPSLYTQADILVTPSRHDGWAMVVPEAMAAGLPVIGTTATGAACEFIATGKNGWLIGPGDEDQLYQAMLAATRLASGQLNDFSLAAARTVARHQLSDGVLRFAAAAHDSHKSFRREK